MKVMMVYSYTDRSESVCGEGYARLGIKNTVGEIKKNRRIIM